MKNNTASDDGGDSDFDKGIDDEGLTGNANKKLTQKKQCVTLTVWKTESATDVLTQSNILNVTYVAAKKIAAKEQK